MIANYFKIAIRTLLRNRLISFINIFGLGLSMSVAMMVMVRLQDQLNVDNFHPRPASTYRVLSDFHKKNGEHWRMASTPVPMYDRVKSLPGIDDAVSVYPALSGKAIANGKEIYVNGVFTEASFFSVFGFSLKEGNAPTVFQEANGIVISQSTADKFFGRTSALGKTIRFESGQNFIVTGVMNEPPGKSHLLFDAYAPMTAVVQMKKEKTSADITNDWYAFNAAYTYVVLKDGLGANAFEKELQTVSNEINKNSPEGKVAFELQGIKKITPGSESLLHDRSNSSWSKFYFEISVALIILLAACFNYTNLTIARALTRAKEVGVRKINGANRKQIFTQFIVESVTVTYAALCFAWILLAFIVHYAPFNDDYEFIPSTFRYSSSIVVFSILFASGTGLLAGIAPAWILSSFRPIRVLKNLKTARLFGKISLQKSFIVFQYSLSLVIIIFLTAFYRQFAHLGAADTGFKRENVFMIPLHGLDEKLVAQKISSVPGVNAVSAFSGSLGKHFDGLSMQVWTNDKQNAKSLNYYYADAGFVPNMDLAIVAGRNFQVTETGGEQFVLINEQAVHALGIQNNNAAIGQQLWLNDTTKLEVLGVVKNFHYENAGISIRPLALRNKQNAYNYLFVNTAGKNKDQIVTQAKAIMSGFIPSQQFDGIWLDDVIGKGNSQAATISLLGYLAFIAIAIASLGLLGLVIYSVETRRKEISIRKIVGAGESQLVYFLSKNFTILLLVAGLIAMPLGYLGGKLFLQGFADRVDFGMGSVLAGFGLLLLVGLTVIVSQTYKAAIQNPVNSLRTE